MKLFKRVAPRHRIILMSLLLAALCACCAGQPASPAAETPGFTQIVGQILDDPEGFAGQKVQVIGYFRGWDLLKEAEGESPVTRSDWVVKDDSGAIYVTVGGETTGSLSPGEMADTEKVIRVAGIVRLADSGQPYIEPTTVEVLN